MLEPKITGLVETAVYVSDLERAKAFYRDALGLEVIGRMAGRHVFLRVGKSILLLFRAEETLKGGAIPPHGARGPGHFALGIKVQELESWRKRLQACRIEIEREVTWPQGGQSLYLRDPDGNSVELITPDVWDGAVSDDGIPQAALSICGRREMKRRDALLLCDRWLPLWTGNQPERLIEVYSDDAFYRDPANPEGIRGKSNLLLYFRKLLAAFPDWVWEAKDAFPIDDGFVLRWKATIPVADAVIVEQGLDLVLIEEGKIIRNEVYFDRSALLAALAKRGG